jgi:hypothetical protein
MRIFATGPAHICTQDWAHLQQDPLAVATLLIHFFAEMPEPLLT